MKLRSLDRIPTVVSIGLDGSNKDVLRGLAAHGVRINLNTVSQIRGGFMPGTYVEYQLACEGVLFRDDGSKKIEVYKKIADLGAQWSTEQRKLQQSLTARGLLNAVVEDTKFSIGNIQRALRAMRLDLIYPSTKTSNNELPEVNTVFQSETERFMLDKICDGSKPVTRLRGAWISNSIGDFYKLLYQLKSNGTVGSWVPYEMLLMDVFYKVIGNSLTQFDRLALETAITPLTRAPRQRSTQTVVKEVVEDTGIPADANILGQQRNLLVYGGFANPIWEHTKT